MESTFGHVASMAAHGDTLYFAEYADFNDPPPRIAKLEEAGPPSTVVAGARASQLRMVGDTLYYLESGALKSIDVATANATPVVLNTVAGIVAFDERHVVYKDETNIYAVAAGAPDLTGAVTLYTDSASIYSATIAADTLYLSSRDGVYRVGLDGTGAADVVADDSFSFIGLIASDGTSLYFDDSDTLKVAPVAGGMPRSFGLAGPDSLFDNTAKFSKLYPAGAVIYWADDGSTYGWTALDGLSCGILGTHDAFFEGGGALADSYFYASGEKSIYRVKRVN